MVLFPVMFAWLTVMHRHSRRCTLQYTEGYSACLQWPDESRFDYCTWLSDSKAWLGTFVDRSTVQTANSREVAWPKLMVGQHLWNGWGMRGKVPPPPHLWSFSSAVFQTVPMFIWLTMALACLFKVDCQASPLFTHSFSRQSRKVHECTFFTVFA